MPETSTADGWLDVIASAIGPGTPARVQVLSGQDGSLLHEVTRDREADHDNRFGYVLSGAGDVNGDGFGDFLVGDPGWTNNHGDGKRSYPRLLGARRSRADRPSRRGPTGVAAFRVDGFGCAVSAAGDVDADGHADVIVGANRVLTTGLGFVYSGERGVMLWEVEALAAYNVKVRPLRSLHPANR